MSRYFGLVLLIFVIGCSPSSKKSVEYYQNGNNQYKEGNLINSILWYNKAIDLDNTMTEAYLKRAEAKLAVLDYQGATEDFTRVIELDPGRTEAYLNRGLIKIYKKEFTDEAVSDFNKVIELNPKIADAWYNRGVVYFVQNKREAACKDWKHSVELGSKKAVEKIRIYCK